MNKTFLALIFSALFITACTNQAPKAEPIKPIVKEAAITSPPLIQSETKSEVPAFKTGPNLYGLGPWLNSEPIGALEDLKGQVVLLKFWTFGCSNCIHTLPHVQRWHEQYQDQGLTILGIHSPEFAYEHKVENVKKSLDKYGLTFPVALDNDFKTWRSFENRYWPAFYLIDTEGNIVYKHFGQDDYEATEERIKALLETVEKTTDNAAQATPSGIETVSVPEIPHSAEEIEVMTEEEKMAAEAELLKAFENVPDTVVEEAMPEVVAETFAPQTIKTGSFKDADRSHKGSGQVKIITQQDGSHLLRLENFSVTNGPDLYVNLAENPDPKKGRDVKSGYVNLERLKANKGNQNYVIPAGTDLTKYGSVVIYCQAYSVVFSVATLE